MLRAPSFEQRFKTVAVVSKKGGADRKE